MAFMKVEMLCCKFFLEHHLFVSMAKYQNKSKCEILWKVSIHIIAL